MDHGYQGSWTAIFGLVVAGAAIFLGLAWSCSTGHRRPPNSVFAIGTLKSLGTFQEDFKGQVLVDQDRDGVGEYGTFQELAGCAPCRGTGIIADPTLMSANFGTTAAAGVRGEANRSGYCFLIYLPDADGTPMPEAVALARGMRPEAADRQEASWVAYAWPISDLSGDRVFATTGPGRMFELVEAADRFVGTDAIPPGDALEDGWQPMEVGR